LRPKRMLKKTISLPLAHARGSVTTAFPSRDCEGVVRSVGLNNMEVYA
jgi:hypothetical protein